MNQEVIEPVMISALEHYSYCPRQCGLIHLDHIFEENIYTLRGRMIHERVDEGKSSIEDGVRIERDLPLWSKRLGLVGKADLVEFYGDAPYPVEYKLGPSREHPHAALQLCGQALCLEEMLKREVPRGAIFHHASRRRREVIFDDPLRKRVEKVTVKIRELLNFFVLPAPANDRRCKNCSLQESCLPSVVGEKERIKKLYKKIFVSEDSGVLRNETDT